MSTLLEVKKNVHLLEWFQFKQKNVIQIILWHFNGVVFVVLSSIIFSFQQIDQERNALINHRQFFPQI